MKAIVNANFIVEDNIKKGVLLFDEKIEGFFENLPKNFNGQIVDAKDNFVSAGFIDIHIHGMGGADIMDATPKALNTISNIMVKTGVTSFLATTMTMSKESILNALKNIEKNRDSLKGSQILGVHLDGPFINPLKNGAQNKKHIISPSLELIEPFIDIIKLITLAPEVKNAKEFIKEIKTKYPHIILSIGHSNASYDEAIESFNLGISHSTHLFNAMPHYHHRDPSIVGAVFESDVTCDIIPDLVHTHPTTLNLTSKLKKNRLIPITDSIRAGCMKNGFYDLGGQNVSVMDNKAILSNGTLAGSILTLNEGLKNMQKHTNLSLVELINSVTTLPAKKLNLNKKGSLKKGYDSDIVIFDTDFTINKTIINGIIKYSKENLC